MDVVVFFAFYKALDLNNQKNLWLPSIFQFERTVHNLNHPSFYVWFRFFMKQTLGETNADITITLLKKILFSPFKDNSFI